MFIIAFVIAAFNLASGAPILPLTPSFEPITPLTIFGRELPDCVKVARCRTLQDIIWSCLATIFACTWVAVHPNVPRPQDSGWKRLKQRVLIMVYAILTPEFIIMWAMRQRIGAAEHMRKYNNKFYPSVTPPSHSIWWLIKCWFRRPEDEKSGGLWTLTHGFLLEMRGLVDDSGKSVQSVDSKRPFTNVVDIPEEEIHDKSKGDFLAKLLVILQTTWFLFQCLARWITHLPVTELEVITLAFALLNLGTYALWWNKPQKMSVAIRMDRYRRCKDPKDQKETTEINRGSVVPGTASESVEGTSSEGGPRISQGDAEGQNIDCIRSVNMVPLGPEPPLRHQPRQIFGHLGRIVEECFCGSNAPINMATTIRLPPWVRTILSRGIIDFVFKPFLPLLTMAITAGHHDIDDDDDECDLIFYSSQRGHHRVSICFLIIGTVFGGLHLIPLWSSSFPSFYEELLWQLSAILITVVPPLSVCLVFSMSRAPIPLAVEFVFSICLAGGGFLYLVARIILVVLAFTTLRELPPDVFQNIAWTAFFPHF